MTRSLCLRAGSEEWWNIAEDVCVAQARCLTFAVQSVLCGIPLLQPRPPPCVDGTHKQLLELHPS